MRFAGAATDVGRAGVHSGHHFDFPAAAGNTSVTQAPAGRSTGCNIAKADWLDPLIQVSDPILDAPEPKRPGYW